MEKTFDPIQVAIRSYQSIDSLDFEIKGFTCITGGTNIGKSAIMRAVSSSILNDPVIGMVRRGAQFASVDMSCSSWGFRWEKGEKGVNRYIIQGKTYDKTGQKQLEQVAGMGFKSISVGDEEVQPWWAAQFFPLFLLNNSGPQVTNFISEVSNLKILQDAIILSSRGKRKSSDDVKRTLEEKRKIKEKLEKISNLTNVEVLWKDIEDQKLSTEEYENKLAQIKLFADSIEVIQNKVKALTNLEQVNINEAILDDDITKNAKILEYWNKLELFAKKIIKLRPHKDVQIPDCPESEYKRYSNISPFMKIPDLKEKLNRLSDIDKIKIPQIKEDGVNQLKNLQSHMNRLDKIVLNIKKFKKFEKGIKIANDNYDTEISNIKKIDGYVDIIDMKRAKMKVLEEDLTKIVDELKIVEEELGQFDKCPTCGHDLDKGKSHNHQAA